jgi:uncharacterized cupredoxin-like copper-binding protein
MGTSSSVLLALASAMVLTAPANAADEATQVNVALLDMSSFMGPSTAAEDGFFGGIMGRGMMGNGWGMMGMGHMIVRTDHPAVKAGPIHFSVTNWSRAVIHEMLVVAVDSADSPLPYDYNTAKVPEDQVKSMGEVGELKANESGGLDATLTPGTYILLCNVPGHYAAGMWTALTVTP